MSKIILAANGLSKQVMLGDQRLSIVENVDLQLQAGESLAIVGASGSGKTSLLGLLAGLDAPSAGKVHLDGQDLTTLSEDGRAALRAKSVGFVFQDFNLLPALTALDNVMLPLELQGDKEARARAKAQLQAVGLGERLGHFPRQLSGGEQQRVALARAFVTRPALLFCDEPTGSLDTQTGSQIIDLLFALNSEQDTTLILVTHDPALASRCERAVTMRSGVLA